MNDPPALPPGAQGDGGAAFLSADAALALGSSSGHGGNAADTLRAPYL